jgi:hypothetical protein
MTEPCILYGAPFSLYTGKARAYLIKQRIPYRELANATEHYFKVVLSAVHRWRMPTLELPDGTFLQDGTIIIEHFEQQSGIESAIPATPKQRIISSLFDLIGMEGLLRNVSINGCPTTTLRLEIPRKEGSVWGSLSCEG